MDAFKKEVRDFMNFEWLEKESEFKCSKTLWINDQARSERQIETINSIFQEHRDGECDHCLMLEEQESVENMGEKYVGGFIDLEAYYMDVVECYMAILEKETPSEDSVYGIFKRLDIEDYSFKTALDRLQEPKYVDKYIKEATVDNIKKFIIDEEIGGYKQS